jgi:hypothetical protein
MHQATARRSFQFRQPSAGDDCCRFFGFFGMARTIAKPIFRTMTRTWEQYLHIAMFAAAAAMIIALIVF